MRFSASNSNMITKEYYNALIGQITRGTCSLTVSCIKRKGGVETYHLTSVL